ncbi:MAG TPA: CPXCG motif-containing cysteine-rich protein [Polyangiales bacterium]|nr:CPXCG motif-containing cysteine-rich protein [Polyangiales bacterium]
MDAECSCPYCGEPISLWLDEAGGGTQRYVEDCSVCCRPMTVHVYIDENGEASASVQRDDD